PLRIISDSKTSIDGLTKNLRNWEDEGFTTVKNGQLFQATVAHLRRRTAPTVFQWVKGHSGVEGNEGADRLAVEGCAKPGDADAISASLPGRATAITPKSIAYKIIRQKKMDTPSYQEALDQHETTRNMVYAQDVATDSKGETPSPRQIWKGTMHKDFSRRAKFFLWMLIHNGYKVGKYWRKIPGSEDKGTCEKCGVEETMHHILTECEEHGQKQIWDLASEFWLKRTGAPLRPLIGEIMACGTIKQGK
ncbi:hypothetical protein B0H17DRAFT_935127, partial [Mycena rosella]